MLAKDFSRSYHKDQKYGLKDYFSGHIQKVVDLSMEHAKGLSSLDASFQEIEEIAYLHDVLEDTKANELQIYELFGCRVHRRVVLLTDRPGKNRRERHSQTYPAISEDEVATFVKLMDRLANVSFCDKKIKMYKKEHPYFREQLDKYSKFEFIWDKLEKTINKKYESFSSTKGLVS